MTSKAAKGAGSRRGSYLAILFLIAAAGTVGVSLLRSDSPVVARAAIQIATVKRGPLVRRVEAEGMLVASEVRWLTSSTDGRVDQVLVRKGVRVRPDTMILTMSNPDLEHQLVDAELATKKSEAELANLRVQLQSQYLNERALEAQLGAEATEARLQAERDESLLKMQLGSAMNAKISRARADSLATRLQIEKEKLAISDEARQAQLEAKQAEVAQVQALYALKLQLRDSFLVRAGMDGVVEEIAVDAGLHVASGINLAKVANTARFVARLRVKESQSRGIQLNQKARLFLQDRTYSGRVAHIDNNFRNGILNVDVRIEGAGPPGAHIDVPVDGSIEVEHLEGVLKLDGKILGKPNSRVPIYKLGGDESFAQRVYADLGDLSADGVEILDGLEEGDRVITSDMSTWSNYDRVIVK